MRFALLAFCHGIGYAATSGMTIDTVTLTTDGGTYAAKRLDVVACVKLYTKREMVARARGYWPELFESGDFSYRSLMSLEAYELAIIVNQI